MRRMLRTLRDKGKNLKIANGKAALRVGRNFFNDFYLLAPAMLIRVLVIWIYKFLSKKGEKR